MNISSENQCQAEKIHNLYWIFGSKMILERSTDIDDVGEIAWPLFFCCLLCWIMMYLCIQKGVKSIGKVVYFTVLFPFVLLIVLFVRGVTLPGAWQGIRFYLVPEWHKLLNVKVWVDAAMQIFFSLGPGWGGIVNVASFNKFNDNTRVDSIIVPIANCGTSIFAGFVVFSVLGFMSRELLRIEDFQLSFNILFQTKLVFLWLTWRQAG
jgi:solute carrier family 6 (neurotransmitter transporter, glycine) member 5/9